MMGSVRDDLLMSLLASEAIVDSRGYEILSSEEVEELKKVRIRLSSNKRITLNMIMYSAGATSVAFPTGRNDQKAHSRD